MEEDSRAEWRSSACEGRKVEGDGGVGGFGGRMPCARSASLLLQWTSARFETPKSELTIRYRHSGLG